MKRNRARDEIEFDDCFQNGQLRAGVTHVKVPLRMMNSTSERPTKVVSEPCFIARDRKTARRDFKHYTAYDADIGQQWENPPTGQGSHGLVGCQVGDLCTVRGGAGVYGVEGSPGHLRAIDGTLVCVGDDVTTAAVAAVSTDASKVTADHATKMEGLYQARDAELRQQYLKAN